MAQSAVCFASYYTTHNRGDDAPEWAPPPEVADAIEEAVAGAQDDRGEYEVRRSPKGKVHEEGAVMHEVRRVGGHRLRFVTCLAHRIARGQRKRDDEVSIAKTCRRLAATKGLCWGWSVFGSRWMVRRHPHTARTDRRSMPTVCSSSGDKRTACHSPHPQRPPPPFPPAPTINIAPDRGPTSRLLHLRRRRHRRRHLLACEDRRGSSPLQDRREGRLPRSQRPRQEGRTHQDARHHEAAQGKARSWLSVVGVWLEARRSRATRATTDARGSYGPQDTPRTRARRPRRRRRLRPRAACRRVFPGLGLEQMVEAERMRAADPSSVLPLETPADARKVARNMLQQLGWDTKRELNRSRRSSSRGFDEVLQPTARQTSTSTGYGHDPRLDRRCAGENGAKLEAWPARHAENPSTTPTPPAPTTPASSLPTRISRTGSGSRWSKPNECAPRTRLRPATRNARRRPQGRPQHAPAAGVGYEARQHQRVGQGILRGVRRGAPVAASRLAGGYDPRLRQGGA